MSAATSDAKNTAFAVVRAGRAGAAAGSPGVAERAAEGRVVAEGEGEVMRVWAASVNAPG